MSDSPKVPQSPTVLGSPDASGAELRIADAAGAGSASEAKGASDGHAPTSTGSVLISALAAHVGRVVRLEGWLKNMRSSKKLHFLELRDGTGVVQAIVSLGDVGEALFERAGQLGQETSLRVVGEVRAHPKQPGVFEIGVSALEVIAEAHDYPISPKAHGTDFLMDHRHLWLRSSRQHAILRVRHAIIQAVRRFFDERDFTLVDAPVFTPNACEGTSTLFETDYHGQPAYLTQSGQLYMEAAAAAFGKAYCFGPTFRAEKSKTRRHLAEFWMVEPEVAFMDLDGDMQLAEDFLCFIVDHVLKTRRPELESLERDLTRLERVKAPFPRISYREAITLLQQAGKEVTFGDDFGAEDETIISEQFDRPVIVQRYPSAIKAFYMKQDPEDPALSLCMDVLAPEGYGEIIGGGQREDSLELLEQRIAEHQLPKEAFEWYLDLRRYGSFPHAGFGLGIERTVAWLCGLPHVRETIPFPRMLSRLSP
ncbi:MAG: asparagine--tRNA ligase [Polyangiaceae bacterium]|nr:asparagine--tRNA ligase [Polyangiaceae bacterium]MCW5790834.1 asparagine--tRNA ligase [Polyangiaceae bacterium]